MRKVHEALNVLDVEFLRARLRSAGIRAEIEGVAPGLQGPATPVTLWVRPSDEKRALDLIRTWSPAPTRRPASAAGRKPPPRGPAAAGFRRILVALDGSRGSERVLAWLPRFAPEARLVLVRACLPVTLPGPDGMIASLPPLADECAAYLERLGRRIRPRPETAAVVGRAAGALIREAKERRVDAIALATKGGQPLERRLVGGTTEQLLHGTGIPVLTVPAAGTSRPGRIRTVAVPLDGSPEAEAILRVLLPWARRTRSKIVLIHALTGLDDLEKVAGRASLKGLERIGRTSELYLRRVNARMERLAARLKRGGADARAVYTRGPLPDSLIRTAEEAGAGLIALSMKPHGALRHLLSGGLASRLIQGSPLPVLAIRAGSS
jgi:nucleotide-binding universal stress UspA family protein